MDLTRLTEIGWSESLKAPVLHNFTYKWSANFAYFCHVLTGARVIYPGKSLWQLAKSWCSNFSNSPNFLYPWVNKNNPPSTDKSSFTDIYNCQIRLLKFYTRQHLWNATWKPKRCSLQVCSDKIQEETGSKTIESAFSCEENWCQEH